MMTASLHSLSLCLFDRNGRTFAVRDGLHVTSSMRFVDYMELAEDRRRWFSLWERVLADVASTVSSMGSDVLSPTG